MISRPFKEPIPSSRAALRSNLARERKYSARKYPVPRGAGGISDSGLRKVRNPEPPDGNRENADCELPNGPLGNEEARCEGDLRRPPGESW